MKLLKKQIEAQKGIGILESILSMGILTFLILVSISTTVMLSAHLHTQTKEVDHEIERSIVKRFILKDLMMLNFSFYNLTLADDKGRDFYSLFEGSDIDGFERLFTIENLGRPFYFLRISQKDIPIMMYDPIKAYHDVRAPTSIEDANNPTPLNFVSLNKNNYIVKQDDGKRLWKQNNLLLVSSPNPISLTGTTRVRIPAFLGYISGNQLIPYPNKEGIFIRTHPLERSIIISSVDQFLRTVPSMAGGIPLIYLTPLELVKYQIVDFQFKRSVWSAKIKDFSAPYSVGSGVEKVIFIRKSSNTPIVAVKMSFRFENKY